VSNCVLTGNSVVSDGGGIANGFGTDGTLTVSNCVLTANTAARNGGGIANFSSLGGLRGGTLIVSNCTLAGNSAQSGGGIYTTYNTDGGTQRVSNCSLSGNSAEYGGGIYNGGARVPPGSSSGMMVSNSTLTGNSATAQGGGIYNADTLTVSSGILASNSAPAGGGVFVFSRTPTVTSLLNSIVAQNGGSNIAGSVDGGSSYNLIGVGGSGGLVDGVNHNLVGVADPGLGPVGNHGGSTPTMPLLPGSPAIDTGDPDQAGTPDQRGVVRSGGVNIGAFQASAASFVVSVPDTVTAGIPFDVTVSAIDGYSQPAVGYTGTITFSSADPHGATLPDDYTFTLADGGSHTFVGMTTLYTAGLRDVTVTDAANGLSGSADLNVVAGSAVAFRLIGPGRAVSGVPFDVTVVAVDAWGNTDTGYTGTIHFDSTDGDPGVVLPPDYTFGPGDAGRVTFSGGVTLITAGDQTLTVTDLDSGITGSTLVTL
jgi:hypothetical protein